MPHDFNPGDLPGDNPFNPYIYITNGGTTGGTPGGHDFNPGDLPGDNPFNPYIYIINGGTTGVIAQIQTIIDDLGLAWASLQTVLDTGTSTTAISEMTTVRQTINAATIDSVDYIPGSKFADSVHKVIYEMPGVINGSIACAAHALNEYFVFQLGKTFQVYSANSGLTWPSNFLSFWRDAMNQEILVELGASVNTDGIWNYTADQSIVLDSPLNINVVSGCAAGATMTLTVTHESSIEPISTVTVIIPASTTANTVIPVGADTNGYTMFSGVASVIMTGGENGDNFQIWVAPSTSNY